MWTAPFTAADGEVFTADQWNTVIRDNMNETMAAKSKSDVGLFFVDGDNSVVHRAPKSAWISPNEATTSNVFGDLTTPGPIVDLEDGPAAGAVAFFSARLHFDTVGDIAQAALQFNRASDGAVVIDPLNETSIMYQADSDISRIRIGIFYRADAGMEPGQFTVKYRRVGSGTVTFSHRRLTILQTR